MISIRLKASGGCDQASPPQRNARGLTRQGEGQGGNFAEVSKRL